MLHKSNHDLSSSRQGNTYIFVIDIVCMSMSARYIAHFFSLRVDFVEEKNHAK